MPSQLTVRNVPPELSRRLARLARARDESVNKTVLRLLEGAVGINERRERLARYTTWSREDLSEFAKILRAQRKIDRHLWK